MLDHDCGLSFVDKLVFLTHLSFCILFLLNQIFNVINKSLIYFVYYEECCNPFLDPRTKKEKIQKNKKYMFEKTQKIYNSETRMSKRSNMVKTWLRRFKNTKIKIWQYFVDWWEPCWQIKFNLRNKSPKSDVYGLN
jgi:hypothetical protein